MVQTFASGLNLPEFCQQKYLINQGLSKTSLFRYRRFALHNIPDYQKACDRWWQVRYHRPHKPARDGSIDKPPYCRIQVESLLAVRAGLRDFTTFEFAIAQRAKPNFWRRYYDC